MGSETATPATPCHTWTPWSRVHMECDEAQAYPVQEKGRNSGVKRRSSSRSIKSSAIDTHVFRGVPEIHLIQDASTSSPLCTQVLRMMGREFPRHMQNMYSATILGTGDHSSDRTIVMQHKGKVVSSTSFRWVETFKFMELTLMAVD